MAETVLLTGASGFIGSAVVRQLLSPDYATRFRVATLGAAASRSIPNVAVQRDDQGRYLDLADAFDTADLGPIHHVIHAGAFTPKSGAMAADVDGNTANIVNTLSLMRTLPSPPRRVIFLSTLDVYGPVESLIDEFTPTLGTSLYALSKLYGERVLDALVAEPGFADTTLQILRLGHIYGPGEAAYRKFIPVTIERLLRGEPPVLMTNGLERRAFLFIDDCARMIVAALDLAPGHPVVNLASANAVSVGVIADLLSDIVAEHTGRKLASEQQGSTAGVDAVFNVSLMQRLLGPEQTGLVDGLRREVGAMRAQA